MGLLFLEGFETFGADGDSGTALQTRLEQKWGTVVLNTAAELSDAAYNDEGLCLAPIAYSSLYYMDLAVAPTEEVIVGWAWYSGTFGGNSYLYRGGNAVSLIYLYVNSDGSIKIHSQAGDQTTAAGTIVSGTWYYMELKYKIADSPDGYWELYIDGGLVDSASSIGTSSSNYSLEIEWHRWYVSDSGSKWDDFYIYDNTGDVQEPFGPVKVKALFPDGDDTTDWTSTGANHYDQVNDVPVNTAKYVESDVASDDDLFTFADASDPATAPIYGVQLNLYAAVTDVGVFTLEGVAESNATQDTADETLIDTEGGQYNFVFETDPDTASAWTIDQLNAAIFGVRVG